MKHREINIYYSYINICLLYSWILKFGTVSHFRQKAAEKTDRHLNPLKIIHKVEELMAEDSIIVADGGDFVGSAAYIMRYLNHVRIYKGDLVTLNEPLK